MDATLVPSAETLSAMHPYMGVPRDVRQHAERCILASARFLDGLPHSRDAQVASLALRAFEAGYRAALRGSSPLPTPDAGGAR